MHSIAIKQQGTNVMAREGTQSSVLLHELIEYVLIKPHKNICTFFSLFPILEFRLCRQHFFVLERSKNGTLNRGLSHTASEESQVTRQLQKQQVRIRIPTNGRSEQPGS